MDLNRLRSFYFAAKNLSISKAAHEIGVNQPAISKHIMALEEELACHLVDRLSRKGLVLTEKGQVLYESAKKIMYEADVAEQLLAESSDPTPKGILRIGSTLGFFTSKLMYWIPEFLERYPQLKISIITHDDLDIERRELDAVIRLALPNHPDLIQKSLGTFTYRLFASKSYLSKYGNPSVPEDLDHHRLISFSRDQKSAIEDNRWVLSLGRDKMPPRTPFYEVNVGVGIMHAVNAGLGIGAIPMGDLNADTKSDLVNVLPDYVGEKIQLCFVFPKKLKFSSKLLALNSFLEEKINS